MNKHLHPVPVPLQLLSKYRMFALELRLKEI